MRYLIFAFTIVVVLAVGFRFFKDSDLPSKKPLTDQSNLIDNGIVDANPLLIQSLKNGKYPGSDIVIEETLNPGSNYQRYIASYKSEGLKIYGLLTVPNGDKPKNGWPVIIFNHGYIPPKEYRTTERYIAYTDVFSRNGYILFRPDYRGHDRSEGNPSGAYGSNGYTIDVLNAVASIKKYKYADPKRIGMWGHSMGGFITLRSMVVDPDIKVGVIWAGVVASYPNLINSWHRGTFTPPSSIPTRTLGWRNQLINKYGTPEKNPQFWNSLSANSYLKDIAGPIQLHHGTNDESVPVEFSKELKTELDQAGKTSELYLYEGDDHNISNNFNVAAQRSVEFFDKYLKIQK